jgi:hypothetical protein
MIDTYSAQNTNVPSDIKWGFQICIWDIETPKDYDLKSLPVMSFDMDMDIVKVCDVVVRIPGRAVGTSTVMKCNVKNCTLKTND